MTRVLLSLSLGTACFATSCERPAAGFTIVGAGSNAQVFNAGVPAFGTAAPASPSTASRSAEPVIATTPAAPRATGFAGPVTVIRPDMPKALIVGTPLPRSAPPPNLDVSQTPVLEATVPEGVSLLSKGKPVTSSDEAPIGDLKVVTDGDKNGEDGYFVDIMPGKQWVQIDLGESKEVWLLWAWHSHKLPMIYNDVVAQISDDPVFGTASTVFNNDYDNSSGFGAGKDQTYVETNHGRRIPVAGVKGRYVRFWSKGRDQDDNNHYIEIEVYGK